MPKTTALAFRIRDAVFTLYVETGKPVRVSDIAAHLGVATPVVRKAVAKGPVPGTDDAASGGATVYWPTRAEMRRRYRDLAVLALDQELARATELEEGESK